MTDVYTVNKNMNVRNLLCYEEKFMNGSRELDSAACDLEIKSIIPVLGKAKKKYKLIYIIILATKMNIYSKLNSTSKEHLKHVKLVLKDNFHREEFWTETNDRFASVIGVWHPL